ncbi:MAG: Erwinia phage PEp14, partial [Pseudomonadota bacterium]
VKPAPGMPDEKLPVGEATEITPETVKPAPEVKEHPEVAKIRQEIAKKRAVEAQKQAAADELRAAAAAETDPEIKAAMIKRADAIAPAKKQEKTDGTPSEPVGTGGVRKEASQEGVQEGGDTGAKAAKGGEEALSLDFPKIDEGLLDLKQRVAERAAPPPAPSPRGRRQVRRALERGMADGTLNKDGAALALWALDRNENLASGLRLEVLKPEPGSPAKGAYNSATRIVKLFQGNDNPETAMHEILHHAERMMPEAVQQGIYRAWQRALKAEMEGATPERRAAMDALNRVSSNDMTALDAVKDAFRKGVLKAEDYQYVNPTEYWAVNGARIMHERFTGRGSWRAQARQWMREMIEHVKGTVGVRSDSALLKALNEMLDPEKNTGSQKSPTMIKNRPNSGGSPKVNDASP